MIKKWTPPIYSPFFGAYAKIYTLADKKGEVFYVGCTVKSITERIAQHISEARKPRKGTNGLKNARIAELNFEIVATIVEKKWVTGEKLSWLVSKVRDIELRWINKYMELGYTLCNKEANPRKSQSRKIEDEYVGLSLQTSIGVKKGVIASDKDAIIVTPIPSIQ